jgi:hypothetical protein
MKGTLRNKKRTYFTTNNQASLSFHRTRKTYAPFGRYTPVENRQDGTLSPRVQSVLKSFSR